jgi:hypothetical protein
MVNRVFLPDGTTEITDDSRALIYALGFDSNKYFGRIYPAEMKERISGTGHCDCRGNGEFILLPVDHPDVLEGGKRYMQCRKCGGWSHL